MRGTTGYRLNPIASEFQPTELCLTNQNNVMPLVASEPFVEITLSNSAVSELSISTSNSQDSTELIIYGRKNAMMSM